MSTVSLSEARKQVSDNYRAFIRMLPSLLEEHHGQWVVLRDQKAIKVLATEMDAYHYARRANSRRSDGRYNTSVTRTRSRWGPSVVRLVIEDPVDNTGAIMEGVMLVGRHPRPPVH